MIANVLMSSTEFAQKISSKTFRNKSLLFDGHQA